MSLVQLSRQTLARLPNIKEGFLTKQSYEQIAEKCHVHHRTIERDIQQWVNSGLFETWIKTEFLRLHPLIVESYPDVAYREMARLVGKMVTQKREITEDVSITETRTQNLNLNLYSEEDKVAILDAYRRINKANSSTLEPASLH